MDAGYKRTLKSNPRNSANYLSLLTFGWVLEIFRKGYKKDLEIEDLYDALDEHRSRFLGDQMQRLWNDEVKNASERGEEASLVRVLLRCHGRYYSFLQVILAFTELCFVMTQPLFLGGLIRYFAPGSNVTRQMAFMYAGCIVVTTAFSVFILHAQAMATFHMGMKIRVALCSMIYRKTLRLSKSALGETTVGQAVNLMSNDVSKFDVMLLFLGYILIGPVETLIVAYLAWDQIEIAALFGVAAVLIIIPLQGLLGKVISTLRLRTAKRTDQRIKFMNEIIVGIQVIKMYAWEKPFAHLVALTRKHEIESVRASAYVQGFLMSFARLMGRNISLYLSIVMYVLLGKQITPEKMFVTAGYFNILSVSMAIFLSLAIRYYAEGIVSIKRIKAYLLLEEMVIEEDLNAQNENTNEGSSSKNVMSNGDITSRTDGTQDNTNVTSRIDETQDNTNNEHLETEISLGIPGGIRIRNLTAKWSGEALMENTLTDVSLDVRPGELVAVIGPVGSGKTSLLHAILKELPLSRGSIIVEGSVSYASQEPWLFTGSVRQNIMFGQPYNKHRYQKVVRVCALQRDFELFAHGDRTIVGERGVTLSGGQRARINLARAIYKEADIYLLDDPLSAVDTHVGRHLFDDCICEFLRDKARILITHQLQYLHTADNIVLFHNGTVEATGSYNELHDSGVDFAKQLAEETEDEKEENTSYDSRSSVYKRSRQMSETSTMSVTGDSEPEMIAEIRSRGGVNSKVYKAYCAAGGGCCLAFLVFAVCVLSQIVVSTENYWLSYWSGVEERRLANETADVNKSNTFDLEWMPSTNTCIYIYTGFIIANIVFDIGSTMLFFTMCMRASVRLHNAMFGSITRATMWFFNSYPSGQILNRFSKDMGTLDEVLPHTMIDCVQIGLALLGVVTVVAIVNFWLLIPTAVMFVFFYFMRGYYVSTSRNIKRLEGITRSPVLSHLSASLQGLTTIRAFHAQALLEMEFDNHQDLHSSAWFMFIASSRAFAVWLDSACLIYICLVTVSFLFVGSEQFGGDVGLAITQAIGLIGMIQWGMRQSAELENNMTSLERVLEYTKVESEAPLESLPDKKPEATWPSKGVIMFDHADLAYNKGDPPVLKCVSFAINSYEKVGVVGRTGAGKSSLFSALFRLVELSKGSIIIDGINISTIGLHDLRSKISIIPQEPVLFSGTLRDNLDPFNQYSDGALWSALAEVELKQPVDEFPAGLSHKVSEGGGNFSVGQRQLLCLARAILRNNRILVLDEATANVDPQTDELIQATIRRKFADCTVLTIAHRLHTVMDSDRVIVMDAGKVVEFDHPYLLLKDKHGILHQMVEQTGHAMAESLSKVAHTYYEKNQKRDQEEKS